MLKQTRTILAVSIALAAIAHPAGAASTPERLLFDGNVLFNNSSGPYSSASGPCTTDVAVPTTVSVTQLATVWFTRNTTTKDPLLVAPYNIASPRWDPQQASPLNAKYSNDVVVLEAKDLDPWFDNTDYVGAVPYRFADPSQDWTSGWLYTNNAGGFGRTDINYAKPVVLLQGAQNASLTLSAANNYLLRGKVNFGAGTTLTIPAGTYLFGEKATTGYLVIERGAKIFVNGTKASPVVLTSDQDPTAGAMAPGDNGGLVIHGRAIANCANTAAGDSCVSEGGAGFFGGGNDGDDSGAIRYMRIEYSGKELSVDNELNSLTMNSVGRTTVFEYIQCHLGSDDGFEWFGGTARGKYLISTGADDDQLDWQLGWRGSIQYAIGQMYPNRGDKGIEADNSEFNYSAPFRSNPAIANMTLIGTNPPTPGAGSSNRGIHLRRGTAARIVNSVILGFRGPGLDISDAESFANCPEQNPAKIPSTLVAPVVTAAETIVGPGRSFVAVSPNPIQRSAKITFGLSGDRRDVRAQIFDAQGRLVDTLANGPMRQGVHSLQWTPSRSLPTGQYFFRLTAEDGTAASGKLVMVK
ncbi:MAG TPA: FlgD immunoglobulin-like domain containing protein [Acidobacteriota bacterium]|nr:FlgD immunoglobulin-like domain containing protein [Acidobacteriota bacterium]